MPNESSSGAATTETTSPAGTEPTKSIDSYEKQLTDAVDPKDIEIDHATKTITVGNEETGKISGIPLAEDKELEVKGEKPSYVLEKFPTSEDQAKAYPEIEKKMGEMRQKLGAFTGAPDGEYDFSGVEGIEFDKSNPLYLEATKFFKEQNISQEAAAGLMNLYKNELVGNHEQHETDFKAIGEDAPQQVVNIKQWAINNLTKESADMVSSIMEFPTAEAVKFFNEIKVNKTGIQPPASEHTEVGSSKETLAKLMAYYTDNMYKGENFAQYPEKALVFEKKIAAAMGN